MIPIDVQTIRTGGKEEVFTIRTEVFVNEQQVPEELELDEYEDDAIHFLASTDGQPIGAARMRWIDDQTVKAERVAVLRPYRKKGVGRQLMRALENEARTDGASCMILHAQLEAVPFYERLDYEAYGGSFLDAGIEHVAMRKIL